MSKWFESEHLREELSSKWDESITNAHFLLCVERKWKYLEYSNGEANDNIPLGIWEPWRIQCKESTKSPQEGKKSGRQEREVDGTW